MESKTQNPEFRINPENFYPCKIYPQTMNNKQIQITLFPPVTMSALSSAYVLR